MRISITRTELKILATALITLIALALAPAWWGAAFGQESNTAQSQNSTRPNRIRAIGDGQRATIEGIVIKRNSDTFTLRDSDVINYLVIQHSLPPRRLVQPFGYGSQNPVATNDTSEGRSKNRRVEIKVLVNKGISSQSASEDARSRP